MVDLVFPWFMWIMGVSMALSFSNILPKKPVRHVTMISSFEEDTEYTKELAKFNAKYWDIWKKVCIRTLKLFGLGMFLANGYEYITWRIPGVLQYFAVSYFMTAATILIVYPYTQHLLEKIKLEEKTTSYGADLELEDDESNVDVFSWERLKGSLKIRSWSLILTAYRYEWVLQSLILILFLSIHLGGTAPGCPRGYLGAGGISEESKYQFCTGGIHRYIDFKVFGYDLIYHHATCRELYACRAYDPEGLLGVFSACTLTYIGLMVGRIFLHYKKHQDRLVMILFSAFCILLLAGILCGFSQNEGVMPVNKNLWSTSFILVCGGLGMIGLSLCYIPIDIYHVWSGAPFIYLGMNSILFYMAHQLLQGYFPFQYQIYHENHNSEMLCDCMGVIAWMLIAYYFYRIKFFVKL
jgi:heparan-alpha-glucosaminide N-acetyltransferase